MRMLRVFIVIGALVALNACSDDDDSSSGDTPSAEDAADSDGGGDGEPTEDDGAGEEASAEDTDVDDCSLLTGEEVSRLSDTPLAPDVDGPLGCPYQAEGEVIADFSLRSFRYDGTVEEYAETLVAGAEHAPFDGAGDEAIGIISVDDEVNFIVARKGDLFVEMVMTFLDVPPDSENFTTAQELAGLAIDRLADAA